MKLSFNEYINLKDYRANELVEKQILYNNGKRYGQIVFLAGGAGSGKGFAIKHFMQGEEFKIRDVDEMKIAFQKLDAMKKFTVQDLIDKYGDKISPRDMALIKSEIIEKKLAMSDLNLKTPTHVYLLHVLVRATGAKDKTLELMLAGAEKGQLPNILFDSTFKDVEDMEKVIPALLAAGYEPKNIHVSWVLTNYQIAIKNNKSRAIVVPEDILLATHAGAAQTVYNLVTTAMPESVQGGIYVILNNPENTIFIIDPQTNKPYKDKKGNPVIKDFKYLTLKEPGKPAKKELDVKKQLLTWIKDNVPPGAVDTSDLDKL
jgi:sporulation protein YlmC with PRC-barrel domain